MIIDLGPGRVRLAGNNLVYDYTAFYEIFVERQYSADVSGRTVVDLGAHRGYYSAYALLNGARRVVSYEPQFENHRLLCLTAEEFRVAGLAWEVVEAAAGAQDGYAELFVSDRSWSHSMFPRSDVEIVSRERVAVRGMSGILADATASGNAVVVKVDIEGAECDAILNTPASSWSAVAEVVMEFENRGGCTADQITAHLAEAGLALASRNGPILRYKRSKPTRK